MVLLWIVMLVVVLMLVLVLVALIVLVVLVLLVLARKMCAIPSITPSQTQPNDLFY